MQKTSLISTTTGVLQGYVDKKSQLQYFLGIPYAEPPLGNLRFKATVPKSAWDGVFQAVEYGKAGPQIFDPSEGNYEEFTGIKNPDHKTDWVGSEDNLTLNIIAPNNNADLRPVVVWIHGGANWLESSRLQTYHGDNLVERGNIIFVSINYRLGIFGWLDIEDLGGQEYEGSHSNGLKDQLTALKWIKENIQSFGGDPENITIMGESAGSIDLSWLLTNGHLNGIAKRVVLMSGIAGLIGLSGDLDHGFSKEYSRKDSKDLLEKLSVSSLKDILSRTTEDLMSSMVQIVKSSDTLFYMDSIFWPRRSKFAPVDPFRAVHKVDRDIEVIVGYTAYEMGLWLTWDESLDQHSSAWAAEKIQDFNPQMQSQAAKFYQEIMPNELDGRRAMHMIGDSIFVMPSYYFADQLADNGNKVWMFQFDWKSDDRRGAMHAADQTFLFNSHHTQAGQHICGHPEDESDQQKRQNLTAQMQDIIFAYADNGNPGTSEIHWPRYVSDSRYVLSLDFTPKIISDPVSARRTWWYKNIYSPALRGTKAS